MRVTYRGDTHLKKTCVQTLKGSIVTRLIYAYQILLIQMNELIAQQNMRSVEWRSIGSNSDELEME